MKNLFKIFSFCFLVSYALGASAQSETLDQELSRYIDTFGQNSKTLQVDVAKRLEWSGFSNPKLFDLIEAKLLSGYNSSTKSTRTEIDHLSWMSKALSFSGQPKYLNTLEKVAVDGKHRKLRKYTKRSIAILPKYTEWNKVILADSEWDKSQSNDINRFTIMVTSGIPELITLAAKRVHYSHEYDQKLLDIFEEQLLKNYQRVSDPHQIKAWVWVVKAISGSGQERYKDTIVKLSTLAKSRKLRAHAKKYLKYYS